MLKQILLVTSIGVALAACSSKTKHGEMQPVNAWRNPADVGVDYIVEGSQATLDNCGKGEKGKLEYKRVEGKLYLYVSNMNCAYYQKGDDKPQKLGSSPDGKGARIALEENDPGYHKITFGSKTYFSKDRTENSQADIVYYYVRTPEKAAIALNLKVNDTQPIQIPKCGGTVKATRSGDQVNIVFDDIAKCDTLVLADPDGKVQPRTYSLDKQGQTFGGSRTIPQSFLDLDKKRTTVMFKISKVGEKEVLLKVTFTN